MTKRKLRAYDREFKLNAIKLYQENNKTIEQISQELGLPSNTFSGWLREKNQLGDRAFPGKGHSTVPENEALVKLRKEFELVKRERDILKKALAIFSAT